MVWETLAKPRDKRANRKGGEMGEAKSGAIKRGTLPCQSDHSSTNTTTGSLCIYFAPELVVGFPLCIQRTLVIEASVTSWETLIRE